MISQLAICSGLSAAGRPTLLMPFAQNRDLKNAVDPTLSLTATRASAQTYFDSTGTLQSAATDVMAYDYNPTTLESRGLSLWEARTNSLPNNTMVGAASPTTKPTNWVSFTALTGLSETVSNAGSENGVAYIDWRISGTPSGAGVYLMQFCGNTAIDAVTGQTWTSSLYYKLQAGSLSGISSTSISINERTSAGAGVASGLTTLTPPTSAALSTQRGVSTRTLNGGGTVAKITTDVEFALSGAAIDITLRIGLPQLELGAFVTPVIQTTAAAATRAAPVVSTTSLGWYSQTAGTFVIQAMMPSNVPTGGFPVSFGMNDGTTGKQVATFYTFTSNRIAAYVKDTTDQAVVGSSAGWETTAGTAHKIAFAYAANDFSASLNGGAVGTDLAGTVPTVTTLNVGQGPLGGQILNGYVSSLSYYPRRLPNGTLSGLST